MLDGRDIGTVMFPDAPAKLFVTASPEARGLRRCQELRRAASPPISPTVDRDVRARDAADAARAAAPMKPAADAVLLDTTELDPDEAFAAALALLGS